MARTGFLTAGRLVALWAVRYGGEGSSAGDAVIPYDLARIGFLIALQSVAFFGRGYVCGGAAPQVRELQKYMSIYSPLYPVAHSSSLRSEGPLWSCCVVAVGPLFVVVVLFAAVLDVKDHRKTLLFPDSSGSKRRACVYFTCMHTPSRPNSLVRHSRSSSSS